MNEWVGRNIKECFVYKRPSRRCDVLWLKKIYIFTIWLVQWRRRQIFYIYLAVYMYRTCITTEMATFGLASTEIYEVNLKIMCDITKRSGRDVECDLLWLTKRNAERGTENTWMNECHSVSSRLMMITVVIGGNGPNEVGRHTAAQTDGQTRPSNISLELDYTIQEIC